MPDLLTIGLFALLAVMVIFMFRNSRKRAREQEELRAKIVPGVEVMTSQGIFGTLLSVDDDTNEAVIESTPGTLIRVHRQTLSKVVENETLADEVDTDADATVVPDGASALSAETTADTTADTAAEPESLDNTRARLEEPEFGERTDEAKPKRAPRKKASE
jgi:preprotein translocase subunit YajC